MALTVQIASAHPARASKPALPVGGTVSSKRGLGGGAALETALFGVIKQALFSASGISQGGAVCKRAEAGKPAFATDSTACEGATSYIIAHVSTA